MREMRDMRDILTRPHTIFFFSRFFSSLITYEKICEKKNIYTFVS